MATFDTQMRPEVRDVLGKLKSRIRWYVFAEGLTLAIVLASVLFWISLAVDALWFTATRYELAVWFRVGYIFLAVAVIATGLTYWIGLRLFRSLRSKPLALILERRFPGLNDRLITSVELSDFVTGRESDLTVHLLNRTVTDASEEARRLRVRDVFESRPLRWAAIGAMIAIISTVGYGAAYPEDFNRWVKAFIQQEEVYWDRDTLLDVYVVDEGGDGQDRPFDEDQRYKHPRGGTLTLRIRVPETDPNGKPLVVPDSVNVIYTFEGGDETKSATAERDEQHGKRAFKATFAGVQDNMEFFVVGNDYKNREPYYIDLVDPPRVETLDLHCDYPEYTHLNESSRTSEFVKVLGKQVTVPMETRFALRIATNKPLRSARMEYDRYILRFGWQPRQGAPARQTLAEDEMEFRATLTARGLPEKDAATLAAGVGSPVGGSAAVQKRDFVMEIPESAAKGFFWDKDEETGSGPGLRLPFIISTRDTAAAMERFAENPDDTFAEKQADGEVRPIFPGLTQPFVMPPNSDVRVYLEDANGIRSPDAEEFSLQASADSAPVVQVERFDIGTSVTPNALIPIRGVITDDHGVAYVRLDYRTAIGGQRTTTEGQPWRASELEDAYAPRFDPELGLPREFRLRAFREGKVVDYAMLDVAGIQVEEEALPGQPGGGIRNPRPGDLLAVSVYARDADNLNGPHEARSPQVFEFNIVSEDDLHTILYEKESQIRIRFEDIIREIEKEREELVLRRGTVVEWNQKKQEEPEDGKEDEHKAKLDNLEKSVLFTARRSRSQFQKNHGETRDIESGFRQIRAELINNRLFTESNAQRLDQLIIQELNNATKENTGDFVRLDRILGVMNQNVDDEVDPLDSLDETLAQTDALLTRLKAILQEMKELQGFHEVLQDLRGIIKDQDGLEEATREAQLKRLLEGNDSAPEKP